MFRPALWMSVGLVLVGSIGRAQGPVGEAKLKEKGLRKAGSLYVLPGEAELSRKLKTIQILKRTVSSATQQGEAIVAGAEELKRTVAAISQRRIELKGMLDQGGTPAQRQRIAQRHRRVLSPR